MNTKFKKITALVFTFLIVAFLVVCFFLNTKSFTVPFKKLSNGEINTTEFIAEVKSSYISNVRFKEEFINVNGFFARVTGRNHYNQVTKLKNGMLTYNNKAERDMSDYVNSFTELDKYLKDSGIDHIFMLTPTKVDINETLSPAGTVNYGNLNADKLLAGLEKNGVSYYDFRKTMSASVEQIEQYFYKTDHHWNTDGAFYAYGQILELLDKKYPNANIDLSNANGQNWNVEIYEDAFLGSHGKRVGIPYAGLDDFLLYTPKFDTDMSMYVVKHRNFYSGSFDDTIVTNRNYLTSKNYFNENTYCAYIGGDYPIIYVKNKNADSDLRVLFIKDSFALPLTGFMGTTFKEVITIDPRYLTDCTAAECIETMQPDIVISMINPCIFDDRSYTKLGVKEAIVHKNQTKVDNIFEKESFIVKAEQDVTHAHKAIIGADKISSNLKYKVSFDDVNFLSGESECITIALYNGTQKKYISSYAFDIEYCRENGFEWTITTPKIEQGDDVKIIIYAGRHGQTNGNHVEFKNLKVEKYS